MSLYDEIGGIPGSESSGTSSSIAVSSSSIKLLKDHLRIKNRNDKANPVNPRRNIKPSRSNEVSSHFNYSPASSSNDTSTTGSLLGGDWDISQEYEPFRPNDYEKVLKEKKERKNTLKSRQPQVTATKRLVAHYSDDEEDSRSPPSSPCSKKSVFPSNPTKVVLMTNMVGPGEVDEELEPEVKEECSKYGEVIKCVIYEVPSSIAKPDEAVRIFIEFTRIESAIKAVVDLNGRFFGGRTVKASFYDLNKFKKLELG